MERRSEPIQTRVEPSVRLKLQKYCNKHDRSEAEVVRMFLKKFLKNVNAKQTQE